jgi:hypothetical protein
MDENPYKSPSEFNSSVTTTPQQLVRLLGMAICVVIASALGMAGGNLVGNLVFGLIPATWQYWVKTQAAFIIAPIIAGQVIGGWVGWRAFSFVLPPGHKKKAMPKN